MLSFKQGDVELTGGVHRGRGVYSKECKADVFGICAGISFITTFLIYC